MCCATLVPKPVGGNLLGLDLGAFLRERRVTALCCVPTLLATLEEDLPELRFLLVSGESCPHDLIARWHRPGRRFLNVYGPTEATVTATWTVVHPDRPVTIGVPLPTYSVVILDPEKDVALAPGTMGEIGIAGIGLASRLRQPARPHRARVPAGLPRHPRQSVGKDLPHRRPWPDQRPGRDRAPRPHRHAGQDPRLPHRADRDRIGPAARPRYRAGGGRHPPAPSRCRGAGRLLQPAAERAPGRPWTGSTRPCANCCPRTWCRPTWRSCRPSR